MVTIHAEATPGHQELVLVAGGLDLEEVALSARRLKALSPLFKPSEPRGALTTALTWPAVIELAATFGAAWAPGERLRAWILEQQRARTAPLPTELPDWLELPTGMVPRDYQIAGAWEIARTGRCLIFDEPRCLYGDAQMSINRCGKGFTLSLRDLVGRFNGTAVHSGRSWDLTKPTYVQREVDGVVRLGRIVNAWASGVKTTYTVTTDCGRSIRASVEHPFLTERGWVQLGDLRIGDEVHVRGTQASGEPRQAKADYREVAGLRAHPYAHGENRRTSRFRVGYHRLVAEASLNNLDVESFIGYIRAGHTDELEFLDPDVWAVHHRDHDPSNNRVRNLEVLTHAEHHRRHAIEGKTNSVLCKVTTETVASVVLYGEEETYDIEVADDPHNFLADGFVVHNTGKTITTILGLAIAAGEHGLRGLPMLVVCPASVVDPWVQAFADWAPWWTTVAWRGTPAKRRQLAGTADVYVTSYDTARMDANEMRGAPLAELEAASLVIDESHYIKTHTTHRARAVRRLARIAAKHPGGQHGAFVALSGTPITHHPADLWPTLECLTPGAWPARERWVNRYCDVVPGEYDDEILGLKPHTEPEFRLAITGQHRRVARADVMSQLPPKVYSVRTVDLPAKWRKAYDDFEGQMLAELPPVDGQGGGELSVMDVLSVLAHLRSLSSAAADVEITYGPDVDEHTGEPKRHVHLDLKAPSWKVDALLELLGERPGESVVAFAPSAQLMKIAGAAATAAGHRVGYVIGGQAPAERTEAIRAFQAGELDLICATTGAGGTGITLSRAGTLVFLQRPWSLVESLQAEDRAEGDMSATRGTEIVDIVARNTVDTRVRAVLRERAGQLADLVQDQRLVTELLGGSSTSTDTSMPSPSNVIPIERKSA